MIDTDQSRDTESDEVSDAYTKNLALFYLGLKAKYSVLVSTITEITSEMKTRDIQQEYTMDVESQELEQHGFPTETLRSLGKSAYKHSSMHKAL